MKKTFALCAIAASLTAMAGAASASTTFLFNPLGTGAGSAVSGTVLDQAPGSADAINSNGSGGAVGQCLTAGGFNFASPATGIYSCGSGIATQFVYQANLAQITNSGTPTYNQGDLGRNFTFTASFSELVTNVAIIVNGSGQITSATALFTLNPSQTLTTNFFRMYATGGTAGNNLTGAGFGVGTQILEGHASSSSSSSTSSPLCSYTGTCPNLDNANGDSWNAMKTVSNNGSTTVAFAVDSFLAGYFPNLPIGSLITLSVNTSQVVPFDQVDPSCAVIDQTGVQQGRQLGTIQGNGSCLTNGTLGAVNGAPAIGTFDFLFQADANASLDFQPAPEPGTLALFAGGLMAAGLIGRRRAAKK